MSRRRVLDVLAGDSSTPAFGVTWLPSEIGPAIASGGIGADFAFVTEGGASMRRQVFALHAIDAAAFVVASGPLGLLAAREGVSGAMKRSVTEGLGLAADLSELSGSVAVAVQAAIDAGADAVVIADDLAYADGWLIDPDFVQAVVIGLLADMIESAVKAGTPVFFHSDGDIGRLYPDLRQAGFTGVHIAASSTDVASLVGRALEAGLLPAGGVVTGDLLARPLTSSLERVSSLLGCGLRLVADDGGVTQPDQLSALGELFGLLRGED